MHRSVKEETGNKDLAQEISHTGILYHYKFYSETHLCFFCCFFKKNSHYELARSTNDGRHFPADTRQEQHGSESSRPLSVSRPPPVAFPSPAATTAAAAATVSRPRATLPRAGPRPMPATKDRKGHRGTRTAARNIQDGD